MFYDQPSIMKWSKRFELFFCWALVYHIALLVGLWLASIWLPGGWLQDPLVRLQSCAAVAVIYAAVAIWFWARYEANGKRRAPKTPPPPRTPPVLPTVSVAQKTGG